MYFVSHNKNCDLDKNVCDIGLIHIARTVYQMTLIQEEYWPLGEAIDTAIIRLR